MPLSKIQTNSLATGAVGTSQLASGAVGTSQLASGAITSAVMPTGSVVQVVQSTNTTTYSIAAADTFEDTGYSVTITPSSSSNKILITFSAFGILLNSSHTGCQLLRGSTVVMLNEGYSTNSSHWSQANWGFSYLDSPSTTSSVTYKTQGRPHSSSSSGLVYYQFTGASYTTQVSTIILMEVVA